MPGKPKGTRGAAPARGSAQSAGGARRGAGDPRHRAGGAGGKARLDSGTVRGGSGKTGAVGTRKGRKSPTAKYAKYTLRALEPDLWEARESIAAMTTKEFLFSRGQACIYVSDDQTEIITEYPDGRIEARARHPKAIARVRRPYTPPTGKYTTEELMQMIRDEAPTLEESTFRGRVRVIREATQT